eukprot:752385-Amphidinium_carterae.2
MLLPGVFKCICKVHIAPGDVCAVSIEGFLVRISQAELVSKKKAVDLEQRAEEILKGSRSA